MITNKVITASAPGRIDLCGGPTDWCGMNTLAMAINLRAYATVKKLNDSKLIKIRIGDEYAEYTIPEYDGKLNLFKAVIELSGLSGFELECRTDIPRGSGLGGSAPLTVATVYALNKVFDMHWSKYYMAELAQRAETFKLHTVNGYQDQYAAMFGGVLFMDFRGKSCQRGDYSKSVESEPYTTVEMMTQFFPQSHIVIAVPEITRISSDQTNGSLSDRYLDGEKIIVDSVREMAQNAQKAKKYLIDGELKLFYKSINRDNDFHRIYNFVSPDNEMIIETANSLGAIACNVCGAGRGAVAIFAPNQEVQKNIYENLKDKVQHVFYAINDEGARYEN